MNDNQVKLIGSWASPFVHRVIWALKLKGVEFEYVHEDLQNKSDLLLKYNPVHKKVPVLIHKGKSISESLVILEYIEETWPDNYPLLPKDPCGKAFARFWAKYPDDKAISCLYPFFTATGEEHKKAVKDSLEMLRTFEEHGLGEKKFLGGDRIGLADLSVGAIVNMLEPMGEVVGANLLEAEKLPRLCAWIERFKQVPVIKENLPNSDRIFGHLKSRREFMQQRCNS